jgi:hypothetical protein
MVICTCVPICVAKKAQVGRSWFSLPPGEKIGDPLDVYVGGGASKA